MSACLSLCLYTVSQKTVWELCQISTNFDIFYRKMAKRLRLCEMQFDEVLTKQFCTVFLRHGVYCLYLISLFICLPLWWITWCDLAIGRPSNLRFTGRKFEFWLGRGHHCVVAFGKLLTAVCLCHQAVTLVPGKGQWCSTREQVTAGLYFADSSHYKNFKIYCIHHEWQASYWL